MFLLDSYYLYVIINYSHNFVVFYSKSRFTLDPYTLYNKITWLNF